MYASQGRQGASGQRLRAVITRSAFSIDEMVAANGN